METEFGISVKYTLALDTNFCVEIMDLQSDNKNRTDTECLRLCPKLFYASGCESKVSVNASYFDLNRNRRDYEENADNLQSNYNRQRLYCNRFKTTNTYISTRNGFNEPRKTSSRDYSESICSRYLNTETEFHSDTPDKHKVENKPSEIGYSIKQKFDNNISAKLNLKNSLDKFSKNLDRKANENLYSDKTTYCRPVVNLYNQEFLLKTIEKNAKLRRLINELGIARQKEKEMENWNNFINDLKRKHSNDIEVKHANSLQYISDEFRTPENFEDIYNTKFTCKQSNLCQKLLKDFYKSHDMKPSHCNDYGIYNEYAHIPKTYNPFKTNTICFPTSSQGRLMMLERERIKCLANRGYKPLFKTINEDKNLENEDVRLISQKEFHLEKQNVIHNSRSTNTIWKNTSTQTEFKIIPLKNKDLLTSKGCNTHHVEYEEGCTKVVHNKGTAPEYFPYTDDNLKGKSLICIEDKLDNLIHSVNTFLMDIKTKSAQNKYFNHHNKIDKRNINHTRSDSYSMARKEKIVCGFMDDSSRSTKNSSIDNFNRIQTIDENLNKINDILLKGIGKNQLITLKGSSVGETYHSCSVQISVTIPTKEISTEVTRSLSKTANLDERNIIIEEIPQREDRQIGIAVNTDPLSLLTILRVSTEETIRRLLSYMPTIDYYSYLSRLQGPPSRVIESQYVCNICGAAFMKPSALTDHIQKHDLGTTRDCCVCRHVLDLPRRRPGLFKCSYCGQRFTRAYCCELHQEQCARRLGKLHDVPSSLMLLR